MNLQRTPLWELHQELGAKMVPFAGYEMPVQYPDGVLKEHLHTRDKAGLFDVSHMGQALLVCDGKDPARYLEQLVPGDIVGLEKGQMRYSVLLNEEGGILDDLMVTRLDAHSLYLVVNASGKARDFKLIEKEIGLYADLNPMEDFALLALQGPEAEEVLQHHIEDKELPSFLHAMKNKINGTEITLSRSGYTGEDGFEISIPGSAVEEISRLFLAHENVEMIGLGARDSLRLEAGLCLYGHDIDESTTPVEADLNWLIPERRRSEGNFPGADYILSQLAEGTKRKRVGIAPEGNAPVRGDTELLDEAGRHIGKITSGGFSPTLEKPIAMGYVASEFSAPGHKITAHLRGRKIECTIVDLPFIKPHYKR